MHEESGRPEPEVRVERRRHKRFRVKDGALAFLENVPGKIIDISAGGMAVHFVVLEELPPALKELDIFVAEDNFFLPDLPCALVSIRSPLPDHPFATVDVKRLSIQFCEIDQDKTSKLDQFILFSTSALA